MGDFQEVLGKISGCLMHRDHMVGDPARDIAGPAKKIRGHRMDLLSALITYFDSCSFQ
jgi:hypothetical protein